MSEKKQLTGTELLNADPGSLTPEQIQQRIAIVQLRKAEREANLVEHENRKYEDEMEARATRAKAQRDSLIAMNEKTAQERASCIHNTGGEGRENFFSGDGALYGSCTAVLTLPTSEVYVLCFRCGSEWHHPRWLGWQREVIEGKRTLAEYQAAERAYNEILRRPRKSFSPLNGEYCAASLFRLPALDAKMQKDDQDFAAYIEEHRRGRPRSA